MVFSTAVVEWTRPSDWFDESVKWNSSHLPSSCCENEEEVENCTLIDAHSDVSGMRPVPCGGRG